MFIFQTSYKIKYKLKKKKMFNAKNTTDLRLHELTNFYLFKEVYIQ